MNQVLVGEIRQQLRRHALGETQCRHLGCIGPIALGARGLAGIGDAAESGIRAVEERKPGLVQLEDARRAHGPLQRAPKTQRVDRRVEQLGFPGVGTPCRLVIGIPISQHELESLCAGQFGEQRHQRLDVEIRVAVRAVDVVGGVEAHDVGQPVRQYRARDRVGLVEILVALVHHPEREPNLTCRQLERRACDRRLEHRLLVAGAVGAGRTDVVHACRGHAADDQDIELAADRPATVRCVRQLLDARAQRVAGLLHALVVLPVLRIDVVVPAVEQWPVDTDRELVHVVTVRCYARPEFREPLGEAHVRGRVAARVEQRLQVRRDVGIRHWHEQQRRRRRRQRLVGRVIRVESPSVELVARCQLETAAGESRHALQRQLQVVEGREVVGVEEVDVLDRITHAPVVRHAARNTVTHREWRAVLVDAECRLVRNRPCRIPVGLEQALERRRARAQRGRSALLDSEGAGCEKRRIGAKRALARSKILERITRVVTLVVGEGLAFRVADMGEELAATVREFEPTCYVSVVLVAVTLVADAPATVELQAVEFLQQLEVDHARDRVRAVHGRRTARDHLDALDQRSRDDVDVDDTVTVRRNQATTVHQHQCPPG